MAVTWLLGSWYIKLTLKIEPIYKSVVKNRPIVITVSNEQNKYLLINNFYWLNIYEMILS